MPVFWVVGAWLEETPEQETETETENKDRGAVGNS